VIATPALQPLLLWAKGRRRTVRLRLTLLYGGLFLVSGIALLSITYVLVAHSGSGSAVLYRRAGGTARAGPARFDRKVTLGTRPLFPISRAAQARLDRLEAQTRRQHAADMHDLLLSSGVALFVMALLSVALGWLVAGRALRPLRTMTTTARRISEHNLHTRLALPGPSDELKDLGDTVDDLLGRLETAFAAQRRFVANASHELRTPPTVSRALLEANLSDPAATTDSFRDTSRRLLEISEQQDRLIEALLTLASSERGLERRDSVDLARVADESMRARGSEARDRSLRIETSLEPAPVSGDINLIERLVANLIDNALRHNRPGGAIEIRAGRQEGGVGFLSIANTGASISPEQVERLFQPFQRGGADRANCADGHGLGLSIVQAIATAHGARITAHAESRGGLAITVRFPGTNEPGLYQRARQDKVRARASHQTMTSRPSCGPYS
jgi:signal transduction histidine kinase